MSSVFRIDKREYSIPRPGKQTAEQAKQIKQISHELDVAKQQGRFAHLIREEYSVIPKKAFQIVADFIKNKDRKIYGGTAINMQLPSGRKIYTQREAPDYDFYSPQPWKDAIELSDELFAAGLRYTEAKAGIHKGTFRVFADFWPVADITFLPQDVYDQIPTMKKNGYTIVSPAYLQMTLYNLIAKPLEAPTRWPNVALRQNLLDNWAPPKYRIKQCSSEFIRADEKVTIDKDLEMALDVVYRQARQEKLIHYGALAYNKYIQYGGGKLRIPVYFYELLAENAEKYVKQFKREIRNITDKKITSKIFYLPYKDINNTSYVLYMKIDEERYPICVITKLTRCVPYKYFGGRYLCSIDYLKYELYNQMFSEDTDLHAYNVSCLIRYLDYIQQKYYKKHGKTETDKTPFQRFVTKCRGPYVDIVRNEFYSRWVTRAKQETRITDVLPRNDSVTLTGVRGSKIRVYPRSIVEPPECRGLEKEACVYPCNWIKETNRCGGIPFGGYQPGKKPPIKVRATGNIEIKKK